MWTIRIYEVYNEGSIEYIRGLAMSTVTASGWSGLVNDVHSTTYETVSEKLPVGGIIEREMQKRGDYSLAKLTGATVQGSRAVIDAVEAASADHTYAGGTTWNDGTVGDPSDATGQGAVTRIQEPKPLGGERGNALVNVVPDIDATGLGQIFDTTITHAYVADTSGNGGPAMAANAANATQV